MLNPFTETSKFEPPKQERKKDGEFLVIVSLYFCTNSDVSIKGFNHIKSLNSDVSMKEFYHIKSLN